VKVEGKAKNEVYQPIPDPPTLLDLDYLLLMAFGHQMPNVGIEEDMPLDMMAFVAIQVRVKRSTSAQNQAHTISICCR